MKFITGQPALLLRGRVLVIGDLHLGIEYEFRKAGVRLPHRTDKLLEKTRGLVRQTKAKRLIILGDVKHKVPGLSFQEEREIPHFLNQLDRIVDVEIVPGNHDGQLQRLVPNIKFHPSQGLLLGKTYLAHGHSWPSPDFLRADQVIIGHNHPMIEFRDKLGYVWREPVWVRAGLDRKKLAARYGKVRKPPELVVFPTFNDFAGGRAVNSFYGKKGAFMGPLAKCARPRSAKIYLLDGTYLGELGRL